MMRRPMHLPVNESYLFRALRDRGREDLHAKALDLRRRVSGFLATVGTTFPHYPSHAVDHSDEIIRSISAVVEGGPTAKPLDLNATEVYLLLLSAYLHDSGMVVSEGDKLRALDSREWQYYLRGDKATAKAYEQVRDLSMRAESENDDRLRYQAGLDLRMLIAEFFRRHHSRRASLMITETLAVPEDYLDSDPTAANTLVATCVGHGLARADLLDDHDYPTARTIFGEEVNVRLLAILLRIGDLLDMRYDRACPLIANVASPLPVASVAHWDQYGKIVDRLVSPEKIRIEAICNSIDEHRLLRDWCQWLADEVRDVPRLLAGGSRHEAWRPPFVDVDGADATISIVRAPGANYRVIDWRFELDRDEVLMRLVHDSNPNPLGFVQELVQNALDATRTHAALLDRNPGSGDGGDFDIKVLLSTDEDERVTAVTVEDRGTGMTEDVIEQYLLQIGRSWYRSEEFRALGGFAPSSRFGIGFLSCFAVSDEVYLTTRHVAAGADKALRLHIPGPRNYLAIADASRSYPGTTVEVRLREPVSQKDITSRLATFCKANEYAVVVEADGKQVMHLPDEYVPDWSSTESEGGTVTRRVVHWDKDGVTGEAMFFVVEREGREYWDVTSWSLRKNVLRELDNGPSWLALKGLQHDARAIGVLSGEVATRINVHRHIPDVGLDRKHVDFREYMRPLESAVEEHLDMVPWSEYRYRERVARKFEYWCSPEWRNRVPATRRAFSRAGVHYLSELEVLSVDRVGMIWVDGQQHALLEEQEALEDEQIALARACEWLTLTGGDLRHGVGLGLALNLQQDYEPVAFRRLGEFSTGAKGWSLDLVPRLKAADSWLSEFALSKTLVFEQGSDELIGLKTPLFMDMVLWNARCPLIQDLDRVLGAVPSLQRVMSIELPGIFKSGEKYVVNRLRRILDQCAEEADAPALRAWSARTYEYDESSLSLWLRN
jgi:hypothetical protein